MRWALVLAILGISPAASAAVRVGEVSAARSEMVPALRRAVEDEVSRLRVRRDAVVSVSLVRFEGGACVVSAVLRDPSGAMFAMIEGRAAAEGAAALRAAVHGAISRIPDAMR